MAEFLVYRYLMYFGGNKHKFLDKRYIINFSKAQMRSEWLAMSSAGYSFTEQLRQGSHVSQIRENVSSGSK